MYITAWGSLSHISQQSHIAGFPLARVYSTSDGSTFASSGVPYFYMTPNDPELKDIFVSTYEYHTNFILTISNVVKGFSFLRGGGRSTTMADQDITKGGGHIISFIIN